MAIAHGRTSSTSEPRSGDGSLGRATPSRGVGHQPADVVLQGVRDEFRTALREEIETARRTASSQAVALSNGRRVAQVGGSYQYLFQVDSLLNLPGDAPGDLVVGGRVHDVMIVAVDGSAITVSVPTDLGVFVPTARLQSNLTLLMRKLITRIEELGEAPNLAGDRIRGACTVGGSLAQVALPDLNAGQTEAVASALGRDTTFIWGPPGTGKTRTIGAIGVQLFQRDRSLLLVSHTNAAVDQALVAIAEDVTSIDPGAISDGKFLRVGDPTDTRLLERPDLLLTTHVDRRALELVDRRDGLCHEREGLTERVLALGRDIALYEWTLDARQDLFDMGAELTEIQNLEGELSSVRATGSAIEGESPRWQRAMRAANTALSQQVELSEHVSALSICRSRRDALDRELGSSDYALTEARRVLSLAQQLEPHRRRRDELPSTGAQRAVLDQERSRHATLSWQLDAAQADLAEADELLTRTEATGGLTRRWRSLPTPEEQRQVVAACRTNLERLGDAAQQAEHRVAVESAVLSEVEDLERNLVPHDGLPREAVQLTIVQQVATTRDRTSLELAGLAEEIVETETRVETITRALAEFERDVRTTPADLLSAAREHADRLGQISDRRNQLELTSRQRRTALATSLTRRVDVLREFGLLDAPRGTAETMVSQIIGAHHAAKARFEHLDLAVLRRETDDANQRIRDIDTEIATVEEALKRVEELVIANASIIATTLTRAYLRDSIQSRRFDTVILDEASMAPIPALWIAASLADANVVAVGDYLQLPPIVLSSHDLAKKWLGRDVFDAAGITDHHTAPPHFVKLVEQFRMHPDVSAIPNQLVYDGVLVDAPITTTRRPPPWYHSWEHDAPVVLVDTASTGAWVTSASRGNSPSRLNFLSATVCCDIAERLLAPGRQPLTPGAGPRIIIISPYRPHAKLLELLINEQGLTGEVRAGTAHTFQGSEADVVILDLVNDDPHWRVGLFMPERDADNRRLFNVALTRARQRLIVVGDLAYNTKLSKKAFLGKTLLPFLTQRYEIVDALDIVPSGLAARAAEAHCKATGGVIEPTADRLVMTQDKFFPLFAGDLARAHRRVVIYSPFITANRLSELETHLRAARERGIAVFVVTKSHSDRGKRELDGYRALERSLTQWGAVVIHKAKMHEKLVFIDDQVVWVGSLNPLSFSDTQEVMERRNNRAVFEDFAQTLRLDDLLADFSGTAPPYCPYCSSEVIASEGKNDPWYWRCVQDGCYSRSIDQPQLTDGQIVCSSCSGAVEFGEWGGDPAWRCLKNRRHRQPVVRSHLRLPKMRARVSKSDLRVLEARWGLPTSPATTQGPGANT